MKVPLCVRIVLKLIGDKDSNYMTVTLGYISSLSPCFPCEVQGFSIALEILLPILPCRL